MVVKADGLAAGKGVTVARDVEEATAAAEEMLSGERFGAAGREIVVEEFLEGEEASFICMTDGTHIVPFASSQDHKARDDGDLGPNTGGMGAYSPAPVVTREVHERIMAEVVGPTVLGMAADGARYQGFLYAGLMITPDGTPKVIEFNCRFGDPEAQPVLMRLRGDLAALCRRALGEGLAGVRLDWDPRAAVGVVMAAGGYPLDYARAKPFPGSRTTCPTPRCSMRARRSMAAERSPAGGACCASPPSASRSPRRGPGRTNASHAWVGRMRTTGAISDIAR